MISFDLKVFKINFSLQSNTSKTLSGRLSECKRKGQIKQKEMIIS